MGILLLLSRLKAAEVGEFEHFLLFHPGVAFVNLQLGHAQLAFLVERVHLLHNTYAALPKGASVLGVEATELLGKFVPCESACAFRASSGEDNISAHFAVLDEPWQGGALVGELWGSRAQQ